MDQNNWSKQNVDTSVEFLTYFVSEKNDGSGLRQLGDRRTIRRHCVILTCT